MAAAVVTVQTKATLEAQVEAAEELVLLEPAQLHITPRTQAVRHSTQLQLLAKIDLEAEAAVETPTATVDTRPSSAEAEVVVAPTFLAQEGQAVPVYSAQAEAQAEEEPPQLWLAE
jgi:hypothetical protein